MGQEQLGETFQHSLTGAQVVLSQEELESEVAPPKAVAYTEAVAKHEGRPIAKLVGISDPTTDSTAASVAARTLLDMPEYTGDGVSWSRKKGNVLKVGGTVVGGGYQGYHLSQAKRHSDPEQRKCTLRIKRKGIDRLFKKRDSLAKKGLSVSHLTQLAEEERHGAAFVIAAVYLFEEMKRQAGGRPLVDVHFPDSANPHGAFLWHIDNHAEDVDKYIERTLICQLSAGRASVSIAGKGEVDYPGVGGIVSFPAWALHRTTRVDPEGASMWKLAAFFGPAVRLPSPSCHPRRLPPPFHGFTADD